MKDFLKRAWQFIWHSDSWQSWVVNVILAFIIIRFLFYPAIGMITGTSLPVVAVISESMEHRLNVDDGVYYMCGVSFRTNRDISFESWWAICGDWYESNTDIDQSLFESFKFKDGLYKGDIIFATGKDSDKIEVGDIIIFRTSQPVPIIHRVIKTSEVDGTYYFTTKGDNNADINRAINEDRIHEDNVLGVAKARLPLVGYLRIYAARIIGF